MNKNILRHLFLHYSYLNHLGHGFLGLLPPLIRSPLWRLILGKCGSRVYIDNNVYFRYPGRVEIGQDVSINYGCQFYPSWHDKSIRIEIKNNVRIGPNCCFFSAGHDTTRLDLPDNSASIIIEDNVWIGGNSTILQGVTIGEGAIVAASSTVTRDVEPYTIVAGIPAKAIKQRELTDDQV